MILCDTGPLVAILNSNDSQHARCVAVLRQLPAAPLLTTLPCMVEAMYLLHRVGGAAAQARLWQMRREEKLWIHLRTSEELDRMEFLMEKYADVPMDFADASRVAAAESLAVKIIFTLDKHFYTYRINDKESFLIYP